MKNCHISWSRTIDLGVINPELYYCATTSTFLIYHRLPLVLMSLHVPLRINQLFIYIDVYNLLSVVDCMDPECGGHGTCVTGTCYCKAGWQGANCTTLDQQVYQCLPGCSEHGTYDLETASCICESYWTGPDCSQGLFFLQLLKLFILKKRKKSFYPLYRCSFILPSITINCLSEVS